MLNITENEVAVRIGDKDLVLSSDNGNFIIESLDGTKKVSIEFARKENLRATMDIINSIYYNSYYKEEIRVQRLKAEKAINKVRGEKCSKDAQSVDTKETSKKMEEL